MLISWLSHLAKSCRPFAPSLLVLAIRHRIRPFFYAPLPPGRQLRGCGVCHRLRSWACCFLPGGCMALREASHRRQAMAQPFYALGVAGAAERKHQCPLGIRHQRRSGMPTDTKHVISVAEAFTQRPILHPEGQSVNGQAHSRATGHAHEHSTKRSSIITPHVSECTSRHGPISKACLSGEVGRPLSLGALQRCYDVRLAPTQKLMARITRVDGHR